MDWNPSSSRTFCGSKAAYLQTSSFSLILSLELPLWVAGTDHNWPAHSWPVPTLSSALLGCCSFAKGSGGRQSLGTASTALQPEPKLRPGGWEQDIYGVTSSRFPETSARRRRSEVWVLGQGYVEGVISVLWLGT